ncbi:MAG: hypothetical protein KH452_11365 [Clostridiales bacterium]|nr:hypothetical protein [Clostridiales bacterium]
MSIQLLKKNTSIDADMDSYKKDLRKHRLKNLAIGAGVLAAAALCLLGIGAGMQNRTYETYEVVNSYERSDTMTTQYTEFLNYVLKYGKDGISCVDSDNQLIWSQTYNMQNPVVDVCRGSAAVAEENGTEAMVFDKTGLQGTIETRLPIRQIEVSSQGVVAALLEDGDIMRLNLYNKKGEELANSKFELQETGYPLRMSLSTDATKLAVTFLQVQDGGINACLAFYNFDSVGENYADHMVAAKTIAGTVVPSVQYIDDTHCFAVGTEQLLLYEGKQIPELKAEIPLDREVYSVAASDGGIGLIVEGKEQKYALQVYDTQGNLEFETEFEQEYRELKFSGSNILIYDEFDCMILNGRGKVFFTGTFEESISNLYTLSGRSRYVVMHASRTDEIHLK